MPVASTTSVAGPYDCNGSLKIFPVPFEIVDPADLIVILTDPDGYETTLVYGTQYTVTKSGQSWDNGGNVTTVATYATNYRITIYREVTIDQQTDYLANDTFPAEVHENDHDKITMIAQQIDAKVQRSVRFPVSDPASSIAELPTYQQRAGRYLYFDSPNGRPVTVESITPGSVAITPAAEDLLDDADFPTMLQTLGFSSFMISDIIGAVDAGQAKTNLLIQQMPVIIAASNSPTPWKNMAYYTTGTSGEDLRPAVSSLLASGIQNIHLAPGTYRWETKLTLGVSENLHLNGCGIGLTTIDTNGSKTGMILLPASYTGSIEVGGFKVIHVISTTLPGASTLLSGNASTSETGGDQHWHDITVVTSGSYGSGVTGVHRIYYYLRNMVRCHIVADSLDYQGSTDISYIERCFRLINCHVYLTNTLATSTRKVTLFLDCYQMSGCFVWAKGLPSTGTSTYTCFDGCEGLVGCRIMSDASGPTTGNIGFDTCANVNACHVEQLKGSGYEGCWQLSGCRAYQCSLYGFRTCSLLASCYGYGSGSHGFSGCTYVTACNGSSNLGDGYNATNHIVASQAGANTGYGLNNCKQCQQNYSFSNTAGQYTTSYADQGSNACANTAAGGYNR